MRRALVRSRLAPALLICFLVAIAFRIRFVLDDAFISFRYARNLAEGRGLVWNPGERIEGMTNLLWTLILAAGIEIGVDPVTTSFLVGLACYALTLAAFFLLLRALGIHPVNNLLALLCLGLNYSFAAFATSGLETSLQTATLVGAFAILAGCRRESVKATLALSLVLGIAVWNRLDAAICAGLLLTGRAAQILGLNPFRRQQDRSRSPSRREQARLLIALGAPFALLLSGLMLFKLVYYGTLIPNTYFAKKFEDPAIAASFGWQQMTSFADQYRLVPLLLLTCLGVGVAAARRSLSGLLSAAMLLAWCAYLLHVGGDFMEYRFLVPVLPLAIALAFLALTPWSKIQPLLGLLLAAFTIFGSWQHYRFSQHHYYNEETHLTETLPFLRDHVGAPDQNWAALGRGLGELFDHDGSITIAVYAAGAIPYYSRLRAIDMLGLNDWWIARHGVRAGPRPGHQRLAPLAYLLFRETNLVIQPWPVGDAEERVVRFTPAHVFERYVPAPTGIALPATARILELPLRPRPPTRVLYLLPHPRIERLIANRALRTLPIEPEN